MSIVKISESALLAAGFDRVFVDAVRHLVRQVGSETGGTTLPQLTEQTSALVPIVDNLVILVAAAQVMLSILEVEQDNLPPSNNDLLRRLDDQQAALERSDIALSGLLRTIDDLQAELQASRFSGNELARRVATLENGVT
ncbi:hypothetical protein [Janthinobacterium sp. RA13]|uniref:hypothetical protein n=1 Tax=Janthinobacterium sp. RA13 TaxID=1502762 RepID=UPI00056C8D16|nr:hypothetical protein [Janthinobacterium sp. RA13]